MLEDCVWEAYEHVVFVCVECVTVYGEGAVSVEDERYDQHLVFYGLWYGCVCQLVDKDQLSLG